MLEKDNLTKLIQEILSPSHVDPTDIPDIDLYMDQVTTFMENKLSGYKRNDKDKILTKTMINNYTKAGILVPPKKKKYTKENIILLVLIYRLKQILPINDIAALFSPLLKENERNADESLIYDIYSIFLKIDKDEYYDFQELCYHKSALIEDLTANISAEDNQQLEWLLLVIFLVAQADVYKRLAENIIDKYFNGNVV